MGLFKKKDTHGLAEPASTSTQPISKNSSFNTHDRVDSAYASSEGRSNLSDANVVPMENHGQLQGISSNRNLAVNERNGDVMDGDTGEVISTVTTTTTTTTTTRSRPGKNGETTVQVSNSNQPATQPGAQIQRATTPLNNVAEVHADPIQPQPQRQPEPIRPAAEAAVPALPTQPSQQSTVQPQAQPQLYNQPEPPLTRYRAEATTPAPTFQPGQHTTIQSQPQSQIHPDSLRPGPPPAQVSYGQPSPQPIVPSRNPHRKSREYTDYQPQSPPSPPRPNFSYPNAARSSTSLGDQAAQEPHAGALSSNAPRHYAAASADQYNGTQGSAPRHQGTLSNLRASAAERMDHGTLGDLKKAAIGLHGVGEQLRGTLNNEFDTRLSRPDSERAAYARQKNQAVLDRAQQEMGRLDGRHAPVRTSVPPVPVSQQQRYPQGPVADTPVSPIQPEISHGSGTGSGPYDGRPWDAQPRRDMDYMPQTFTPESTSAPKDERRGLRKLMKPRQ